MKFLTIGLNHNTAPLSLREKVAFNAEEIEHVIPAVKESLGSLEKGGVTEVAILSTCNRTEIYCVAQDPAKANAALKKFLADLKKISLDEIEEHLYTYIQEEAVGHAFRVASGLDSMVLGETQIVGQLKKAVKLARSCNGLGLYLNSLFQKTYSVAKEIRSTTEIGAHSVSLAAAAVKVAGRIFGDLSKANVLFIGAGEMIELCATHFNAQKPTKITVANRTIARAQALADAINADAARLSDLPEILHTYDIIVSCTASSLPIIGLGMVQTAVKKRKFKPIFMVDLAVPRDIESEVSSLDEVYVYSVDDLGKVVQSGIKSRQAAVEIAEELIGNKIEEFRFWLQARDSVPYILALQKRAEMLKNMELSRAKRSLAKGEQPEYVLDRLAESLMKKYLHDPLKALKNDERLDEKGYHDLLNTLQHFFLYHSPH